MKKLGLAMVLAVITVSAPVSAATVMPNVASHLLNSTDNSHFSVNSTFVDYGSGLLGQTTMQRDEKSRVPVPAAAWLFISGLVGMIGVARRKRKEQ